MTSELFSELKVGPMMLANRIVVAPMCQYMAVNGCPTDWHLLHYGSMAMSGASLVMVEATGVTPRGRTSHACLGLYSDECEQTLGRMIASARSVGAAGVKFGMQLNHSGLKASVKTPWQGRDALGPDEDPWRTQAPSPIPRKPGEQIPEVLDEQGLIDVRQAFVDAALRSVRIGFEVVELHMTHGYLLHEFLSPLSNLRNDCWGGTQEGRHSYPLSIAQAVKAVLPPGVVLGARITGSDWVEGGIDPADAAVLAKSLSDVGVDYVCVSSGGVGNGNIPLSRGYQVPFAAEVRRRSGVLTRTAGLIVDPHHANDLIKNGDADMVALARAFMDDPRWVWHAAETLGVDFRFMPQYERIGPKLWSGVKERPIYHFS
jgi:2,4-dienoyl-CoA reductase-like NADH-dependent reductase (Old Yellow Enzyme family)